MGKRILSDVHPGQIWRDRDKRMSSGNRRVRVITVSGPLTPTVAYRVVGFSGQDLGQMHKSRYERFQRAFDLISDLSEGER